MDQENEKIESDSAPKYEDINLICKDCNQPFLFEAGEQAFYAAKGFNPPVRCPEHRALKKQLREGGGSSFPAKDDWRRSDRSDRSSSTRHSKFDRRY